MILPAKKSFSLFVLALLVTLVSSQSLAQPGSDEEKAAVPDNQRLWQLIQKQQRTIESLQTELRQLKNRLDTTVRHVSQQEDELQQVAEALQQVAEAVEEGTPFLL